MGAIMGAILYSQCPIITQFRNSVADVTSGIINNAKNRNRNFQFAASLRIPIGSGDKWSHIPICHRAGRPFGFSAFGIRGCGYSERI